MYSPARFYNLNFDLFIIYLFIIHLFICLSFYSSIYYLSIHLFILLSIHHSILYLEAFQSKLWGWTSILHTNHEQFYTEITLPVNNEPINNKSQQQRTHNVEKAHLCSQCGKGFIKISELTDHHRRERGREGERRKHCEGDTFISCLSHAANWGSGPQPRHVPWLGIEPMTFQFTGQHWNHWATPARACLLIYW